MAKLKAPLLSLGASGAIGKAIVFFPWKGLDVAREYVVPANPKTTAQTTVRDRLKACVALLHVLQALAANAFAAADATAYALLGSLQATPRTWFNTICKQWMDQKVAGKIPMIFAAGLVTPGSLLLTVAMYPYSESSSMTSGKLHYGTSKSNLANSIACTSEELIAGKVIPDLSAGTKYCVQFRPDTPSGFIGSNSGIYYGTPTA